MTQQMVDTLRHEQRIKMSYEEYLAFDHEGGLVEWIDGEALVFMPPLTLHQEIVGFLYGMLSLYVNLFSLGKLLAAPFEMRALPGGNSREPDILFVAHEHMERLNDKRLSGPADLVVEIISDDSVSRDRADKFYEYQEGGVREYWIIDPRPGKERVDFYQLMADGKYQAALPDGEGRYYAAVLPGFWFKPAWLRQQPLPDPLTVLAEIRGLSQEAIQAMQAMLRGNG